MGYENEPASCAGGGCPLRLARSSGRCTHRSVHSAGAFGSRFELQILHAECFARKVTLGSDEVIPVDLRDMARQRRTEEVLRESKRQLDQVVLTRTRDLQEKIKRIQEQQADLLALST